MGRMPRVGGSGACWRSTESARGDSLAATRVRSGPFPTKTRRGLFRSMVVSPHTPPTDSRRIQVLGSVSRYGRLPEVSRWQIERFKSIAIADVGLAPISIITGVNSSGKSSFLQSVLLMAQSIREGEPVLNGSLIALGEPKDIISSGADTMSLGMTLSLPRGSDEPARETLNYNVLLEADDDGLAPVQMTLCKSGATLIEAGFALDDPQSTGSPISGKRLLALRPSLVADQDTTVRTFLTLRGLAPDSLVVFAPVAAQVAHLEEYLSRSASSAQPGRRSMRLGFLNDLVVEMLDDQRSRDLMYRRILSRVERGAGTLRRLQTLWDDLFRSEALRTRFIEAARPVLEDREWWVEPLRAPARIRPRRLSREAFLDPEQWATTIQALALVRETLTTFADSVQYLGPLRAEPSVVYQLGQGAKGLPVGVRGQFTATFLARFRERHVPLGLPDGARSTLPLEQAVSIWADYLGIADSVQVSGQGKLGHSLGVTVDGAARDLTNIGVGASQLLPVIVTVLGAAPGSLILLEQPELHLHPAVQSRLADFFLVARRDLRLIVETHSEYLITRLRRRVAEGSAEPSVFSILFAEYHKGVTEFVSLPVDRTGDLESWPDGFFDAGDVDSRAILQAIATRLGVPRADPP